jgi:hypothetical protein
MAEDGMKIEFTSPKRDSFLGDWSRDCRVAGVDYQVAVRRGSRVRIPYKPVGQNIGFKYNGTVYSGGRCLWSGRVIGSLGVRGLLLKAGVIEKTGD